MRVMFVSSLFPSASEPTRGVHNAQQVAALANQCAIVKIIAPTASPLPPENHFGTEVVHPRFFHIPFFSRPINGWLFARAIDPIVREASFDVVLVNWAYPDAHGVMLLANELNFPFATTVQGSDVNSFFASPTLKRLILRTLRASGAVFTRSEALRQRLAQEGITAATVYNGIDRNEFRPCNRADACASMNLNPQRRRILYVGNLLPVKGPTILANAFADLADLADVDLVFVGSGRESTKINGNGRSRLVGVQPHRDIPKWMNACDVLCLPSLSEGLPNVALEAMACGLPVVASRVGGVPEIVEHGVNGLLVPAGESHALAAALREALTRSWDRWTIRRSIERFDWDSGARTVVSTLEGVRAR
jgi:glycosyltransferase involved in cell wall biosynthesis